MYAVSFVSLEFGVGYAFLLCYMQMFFLNVVYRDRSQLSYVTIPTIQLIMMTSSNGDIFRVTGHLCGEFTGPRWIPHTKASDAELWCFLWYALE